MTELKHHEPGVYVGLPEDEYHADPAIGGSGFKSWVYDPIEWWWSSSHCRYNLPAKETDAMTLGDAIHKILLEGREAYDQFYHAKFNTDDYPYALKTSEDYADKLAEMGLKKSGSKDVRRERLIENGFEGQFIDDLIAEFDVAHEGKRFVSKQWIDRLSLYVAIRQKDPALIELFSEGVPEVSLFWNEGPIRCKCRLDWMRIDKTTDLKSYADYMSFTSKERRIKNITGNRYDLQEAHYSRGRRQCRDLPVFNIGGTDDQVAYVEKAIKHTAGFEFLFVKTTKAPRFTFLDAAVFREASQYDWSQAMQKLTQLYEHFGGVDNAWITVSDRHEVEFTEVPASFGLGTLGMVA